MSQRILDTGKRDLQQRPQPRVDKNWFDLSHFHNFSCNMSELTVVACLEVLPGERAKIGADLLQRLQPMVAPMSWRCTTRTEWFYVANRILAPSFEKFISPPQIGVVAPAAPRLYLGDIVESGDLANRLGLPIGGNFTESGGVPVSAYPFSAVQKIYADWYRDEDINGPEEDYWRPLVEGIQPGEDAARLTEKRWRNWDRDYFTVAKPWPQKGPEVIIPGALSGPIPVTGVAPVQSYTGNFDVQTVSGGLLPVSGPSNPPNVTVSSDTGSPNDIGSIKWDAEKQLRLYGHYADAELGAMVATPDSTGGTIEQLRAAVALQGFLEADSRGGTRYVESVQQHFDYRINDGRVNRAEYLGSTKQNMIVSEVLQTSATSPSDTPQGNMAGHGVSFREHNDIVDYTCPEWGYIIGIQSTLPDTAYQQGAHKMWFREDRLDYAWPEFAQLGEQEILNRELYVGNNDDDRDVFGYGPRYNEYRTMPNRVSGDLATDLDFWGMQQIYSARPALNKSFLQSNATDRIFAVTGPNVQHMLCHARFNIKIRRPLPYFVRPSL